jgi:hypothetical protein
MGSVTPNRPVQVVVSAADKISDVRRALHAAVFPETDGGPFRIWELDDQQLESRFISVTQLKKNRLFTELKESDVVAEDQLSSDDAYAVEVQVDGQWIVPETTESKGAVSSSKQIQPTDVAPKPLFQPGTDFFSKIIPSMAPQTAKPVSVVPTKDPRPVPKPQSILPGTLGLGNM